MRSMTCLVDEIVIRVTATGLSRRIGLGQIVDFDEQVGPVTLGEAVAGREGCFEPVQPEPQPPARRVRARQDATSAPAASEPSIESAAPEQAQE